jgi:hypothetical protein
MTKSLKKLKKRWLNAFHSGAIGIYLADIRSCKDVNKFFDYHKKEIGWKNNGTLYFSHAFNIRSIHYKKKGL